MLPTAFETFSTLRVILANLALAALSCFLIAALLALGAERSLFLRAVTFFRAFSWATKTFFLPESVTAASLAFINATYFLSINMLTFTNLAAAFLTATLAFKILARIAAFLASGAFLRAFLRARTFLTALS